MRSDPRRRGTLLILLSITTLLAAGCGGTDTDAQSKVVPASASTGELVAAAKKEGQVTVYSAQDLTSLNNLAKAFEAKYPGIDVKTVRGVDGDLGVKVETEFNTGKGIADMYVSASLAWVEPQAEAGRFLEPVGPELTGKGAYDAKKYVHKGNYFETNSAVLTFGWNTKLYPKGLTDYTDLLDPALADGKIGVIEPTAPSIVDFYLWLEETYGADFVKKLAAQKPRIYPSSLPMGEALQSGEIAAGSFVAPIALDPAKKKKGAPVDYRMPPDGAWGARYYGMVLQTAPHPNAGQLFANFMVTAEGQKLITLSAGSVLPKVPGTVITNDKVRIQDPAKLTPDTVAAYQKKWKSLFQ
ncbi:ABC transporter substrate-binding protein [Streptomyces sp. NPDC056468]|uniref:ABC transporter substrate-binding protein n=1 Tax=Streptomyces sp. NPDC056468 TaxID=3345830 RepID=UPI0036790A98